ncbi:MAG: class I SAM-dependent methyltransferase [Deferribacteres bacterium]|nr:class I SAM-dependent methyltransferase [Deferribacteres bacterium]
MRDRLIKRFSSKAHLYGVSSEHSATDDVDVAVEMVSPSKEDVYLDVASGTGHAFFRFCPYVGRAFALDLSLDMLSELKKVDPEALVVVADVHEMPFAFDTFTLISSRIAPHHFESLEKFFEEAHRILARGGRMVIIDSAVCDDEELKGFIEEAEKMRDPTHLRTLTFSQWRKLFSRYFDVIGFKVVRKRHPFKEWLERSPVEDDAKRCVERLFRDASPGVKAYFEIEVKNGKVLSYTDDKVVIAGVKK